MANHVRRQIRESVVTLLTGLSTSGANIFANRLQRIDNTELPCLIVQTDREQINPTAVGMDAALERQLSLSVRALAKDNASFDDVIDGMIKEVEQAVNASIASSTLNGLVKDFVLQSIDINYESTGEQPIAEAVMVFAVNYYTLANAPDVSI